MQIVNLVDEPIVDAATQDPDSGTVHMEPVIDAVDSATDTSGQVVRDSGHLESEMDSGSEHNGDQTLADAGYDATAGKSLDAGLDAALYDAGELPPLTDAEIFHVIRAANVAVVEQAEVGLERASSSSTLEFAEMMMVSHSVAVKEGENLADEQEVTPTDNDLSQALRQQSAEAVNALEEASTAEFDSLFMNSQVAFHEQLLSVLNEQLIPQSQNAALQTYLIGLASELDEHRVDAERIVQELP